MITDTNVYLSTWPTRRLRPEDPTQLAEKLRAAGVTQAWAGTFDGLLHKDLTRANSRLHEACVRHGGGTLVPFGCINPTLPDWEADIPRCRTQFGMPGIRLHPNYHGYPLDDPRFARLLDLAGEHNLIVQIALRMEDERTQHALLRVPDVDPTPLWKLLADRPRLQVVLLNALMTLKGTALDEAARLPNVYVEIATLEGIGGIEKLIRTFPFERVLFGSYCPFFILESALLKLQESELGEAIRTGITRTNAERLLAAKSKP